jgi:hypothetical protein
MYPSGNVDLALFDALMAQIAAVERELGGRPDGVVASIAQVLMGCRKTRYLGRRKCLMISI